LLVVALVMVVRLALMVRGVTAVMLVLSELAAVVVLTVVLLVALAAWLTAARGAIIDLEPAAAQGLFPVQRTQ
jgi:hypothetical protein